MNEVAELELPTQENVHFDLRSIFQGTVRLVLESVLEEVAREMIGASRWPRLGSCKDVRNGTYLRRLLTTMGAIDVAAPRTRENGSPVDVIGRYRRRSPEIDAGIVSAYVSGASTRDVGKITEALLGEQVSRSTVSRVAKTLDAKVEELRKAPITGPIPYLFLDATFLDARRARGRDRLGARGLRTRSGRPSAAPRRDHRCSGVRGLVERAPRAARGAGLSGVQLVVADGHAGLAAAVRKWGEVPGPNLGRRHRVPFSPRPAGGHSQRVHAQRGSAMGR